MRLLLVEDHKPLARALRLGLEEEGFAVDLAIDGDEADHKATSTNYDLIILDIMLPKKSGYEVCQRLKSDPATRDMKVVMVSAKGRDVEVAKGVELGADAYVVKPFSTRELVAKVREMLASP